MHVNANFMLACAFSPLKGLKGACTTISDLQWARPDPLFCPTKRSAVRLVIAAGFAITESWGHGNKAAKRAANALCHAEASNARLNRQIAQKRKETTFAAMSETVSESRSISHLQRTSIHE